MTFSQVQPYYLSWTAESLRLKLLKYKLLNIIMASFMHISSILPGSLGLHEI